MREMNLNLITAKTLSDLGVDTIFGVMGDAVMYFIGHYVNDFGGRYIKAFHESNAVQMAVSYSQMTDKVGVVSCTCGPGFANTIGALMEARKSSTPLVLITADAPSVVKAHFQEMNHGAVALACEIAYVRPANPERVQDAVVEAIEKAVRERRPVVLNLPPYNLLGRTKVQYREMSLNLRRERTTTTRHDAVEGCVEAIANAKRPLILVGYGAIKNNALDQIRELADRIEAPIATTLRAKDSFLGHQWNLDIMGGLARPETLDVINKSDCIISIGASCNDFTTEKGSLVNDKTLIMIGVEDQLMYRFARPRSIVNGDIPSALTEIIQWLDEIEQQPSAFAHEHDVATAMQAIAKPRLDDLRLVSGDALTLDYACTRLNEVLNEKVVVTDAGRFVRSVWSNVHASKPGYFICSASFSSLGMGIGHAIGAAVALPDVPVLAFIGDGGFMMGGINEVFNIRTLGLDVITVIVNDGTYGAEYAKLVKEGFDPEISNIDTPPFAEVIRAMGFTTKAVTDKQELAEALEIIRNRDKKSPILIELKLPATSIRFDD
ncbi:MAG: thiamine pyrophosphate-binding protein [Proteobacteria bacterium]|nr:thiamine pyrophosphate-binding protein [Pseudomonadota bacterium]MBS0493219.1 thiamine pyrophosphate-binding protein [Pseudomonadota bacterium]